MWNWRPAAAGQQAPRNTATSKRRRFEAVSKIVQQLPVEMYLSEADLRQLPLAELKVSRDTPAASCQSTYTPLSFVHLLPSWALELLHLSDRARLLRVILIRTKFSSMNAASHCTCTWQYDSTVQGEYGFRN